MNASAFKLLSTSTRRETALVADLWNPFIGSRPEIVIPLPAEGTPGQSEPHMQFMSGQVVRVTRAPHRGSVGKIESVLPEPTRLPSGVQADAARVRLESGETVLVALANMEVLG
jgi:hypothetical protein